MKTNWNLIRKLTNSAIDACEAVDRLGVAEENRGHTFQDGGKVSATMSDYLQSAWTYPENLSYSIVRANHKLGKDKPYTSELARTLMNIGRLCGELVDAQDTGKKVTGVNPHKPDASESIEDMVNNLSSWYEDYMISGVTKIMKS